MQVDDDCILQRLFESLLPSEIEEILEQPLPVADEDDAQTLFVRDEVLKSLEKSVGYIFVLSFFFVDILILFEELAQCCLRVFCALPSVCAPVGLLFFCMLFIVVVCRTCILIISIQ